MSQRNLQQSNATHVRCPWPAPRRRMPVTFESLRRPWALPGSRAIRVPVKPESPRLRPLGLPAWRQRLVITSGLYGRSRSRRHRRRRRHWALPGDGAVLVPVKLFSLSSGPVRHPARGQRLANAGTSSRRVPGASRVADASVARRRISGARGRTVRYEHVCSSDARASFEGVARADDGRRSQTERRRRRTAAH